MWALSMRAAPAPDGFRRKVRQRARTQEGSARAGSGVAAVLPARAMRLGRVSRAVGARQEARLFPCLRQHLSHEARLFPCLRQHLSHEARWLE
jgi:hypothetical protein